MIGTACGGSAAVRDAAPRSTIFTWLLAVTVTTAVFLIVRVAALLARTLWKSSNDGSTEDLANPLLPSVQMQELHSMNEDEDEYFALFSSWRESERQLMVLDHDLRVVLWSKGMTVATHGMVPAPGIHVKALPFASSKDQEMTVAMLQTIIRDTGKTGVVRDLHMKLAYCYLYATDDLHLDPSTVPSLNPYGSWPGFDAPCK